MSHEYPDKDALALGTLVKAATDAVVGEHGKRLSAIEQRLAALEAERFVGGVRSWLADACECCGHEHRDHDGIDGSGQCERYKCTCKQFEAVDRSCTRLRNLAEPGPTPIQRQSGATATNRSAGVSVETPSDSSEPKAHAAGAAPSPVSFDGGPIVDVSPLIRPAPQAERCEACGNLIALPGQLCSRCDFELPCHPQSAPVVASEEDDAEEFAFARLIHVDLGALNDPDRAVCRLRAHDAKVRAEALEEAAKAAENNCLQGAVVAKAIRALQGVKP